MNERLILESLYWLVANTEPGINKLDTREIILHSLGSEIVSLTPKIEQSLQEKTKDALEKKE